MDNSDLKFKESKSIEQFKNDFNATKLEIIRNPINGNLFFTTDAGITGKVTKKINDLSDDELQMSFCEEESGDEYWMLCKKSTSNVVRTL